MASSCNACPRKCNVPRPYGFCGAGEDIKISHYMKHMWEEPFISGQNGSGAVFFSGCNVGCVFCQNYTISQSCDGKSVTHEELKEIFHSLIDSGAHNINLVTPSHYILQIRDVLGSEKLPVPVVYNCSGYEGDISVLDGLCDIYLCDLKYGDKAVAARNSNAPDYVEVCMAALEEMYRQTGDYVMHDGILQRGLVVRHLVLPSNIDNSLDAIDLFARFAKGKKVKLSLMSQYIPHGRACDFPEIDRHLTHEEYDRVVRYVQRRGIEDCLIQDMDSASESFVPDFKNKGEQK